MVELVPVSPADEPFLYRVYAGVRGPEVAAWGWGEAEQELFLQMQFQAQQRGYALQFPGASQSLVRHLGQPAGRLIIWRTEREIRVVDLALLPDVRGRGIGTELLQALQQEAAAVRTSLTLQVEKSNRAANLYRRLGFAVTGESDLYQSMAWEP